MIYTNDQLFPGSMQHDVKARSSLGDDNFSFFVCFSCKNEIISVKFTYDCSKIHAFYYISMNCTKLQNTNICGFDAISDQVIIQNQYKQQHCSCNCLQQIVVELKGYLHMHSLCLVSGYKMLGLITKDEILCCSHAFALYPCLTL